MENRNNEPERHRGGGPTRLTVNREWEARVERRESRLLTLFDEWNEAANRGSSIMGQHGKGC